MNAYKRFCLFLPDYPGVRTLKVKKFIKAGLIVYLLLSVNYLTKGQMPYTRESWQYIATKMPDEWYGYEESKAIAENVLLYQRDLGG